MNKKIILVTGDPNSINSEIIYKSLKKINNRIKKNLIIVSNYELLKKQFKILKYKIKLKIVKNIDHNFKDINTLKVININIPIGKNPFKINKNHASKFVIQSLNFAHTLALKKNVKGIINCGINKELLLKKNIGVTEFLSKKCEIKKDSEVMMIHNEKLSVCPITTHINIKDIAKKINKKKIITKVKTITSWYKRNFKKKPKIAVLGLNPHNAEMVVNSEEKKIILPALNYLKKKGIDIVGPFPADTLFINQYKKFNVIIGMYHDQLLTPLRHYLNLTQLM